MTKIRQVLLFAIVLILLVGVASASDVSDDTTATMETSTITSTSTADANQAVQKDINTPIEDIQEKVNNENEITNKDENKNQTIEKKTKDTNLKKDNIIEVHNYTELRDEVATASSAGADTTIRLLEGLYNNTNTIIWSATDMVLTIEGNNQTINGQGKGVFSIKNEARLVLKNITITNASRSSSWDHGGAISNEKGSLTVTDSTFTNNTANEYGGGAIYNEEGSLTVKDSIFINNTSRGRYGGGAIYNNKGSLTVKDSIFINNTENGASEGGGGAISNDGKYSYSTVTNSTFINNTAKNDGYGGGAIYIQDGRLTVTDSTFTDNTAKNDGYGGGAIYGKYVILTVSNSTFTDNTAKKNGAAIYSDCGYVTVSNSTFTNNTANDTGGAFCNFRNFVPSSSDHLTDHSTTNITSSDFIQNTANKTAAIYAIGPVGLINNTFKENTANNTQTIVFGDNSEGSDKSFKNNTYESTDISLKEIKLNLTDGRNPSTYTTDEDVTLNFTIKPKETNYYKDYKTGINDITLYINGQKNITKNYTEGTYTLSGLEPGNYTVYFTSCNNQSNNIEFKVIGDMEVDVNGYSQLVQAINIAKNEEYKSYKINLGVGVDYEASQNITLKDSATKKIIINGNNNTLNGRNTFQFINVPEGQELILENVKITNYKGENGGAIENEGTLTIINSTLENNKGFNGGAIENEGTLTIINSTVENNNGTNGGAIDNLYGTITITDSTIQNNNGTDGGAILNTHGILTITNTTIQNNIAIWHGGAIYNDKGTLTVINSTIQNNTAEDGGAIYYETDRNYDNIITLYNSNFTDNKAEIGAVIYNNGGYGKYNITYNTFKDNTATEDNETLNLGENIRASTLEENSYISTDIDMKTLILRREEQIPQYLLGEEVTFDFTVELEHPDYYDADILEKLNKTIYNNGTELFTTVESEYISSDLPVGEYSVYFIAGNQQSNNVTFKVNGDIEFNVSSYPVLAQAIEHAKQERFISYTINLMENGDFDATQNLTLNDSKTKKIIIKGNNNTLNGRNYYYFINVPEGQELILQNITISNYKADFGGAISNDGILTITDSTLKNNNATYAGGAVNNTGTLIIKNSTFENNKAGTLGGAIYNNGTLNITDQSLLQNNLGNMGGAVYNIEGSSYIIDSTLENNSAIRDGGAVFNQGSFYIFNSTLQNNTAEDQGGAIYDNYVDVLSVINSTLQNNNAKEGGAIYDFLPSGTNAVVTLYNSNFTDNNATKGAVIYNNGGYGKYNITYNTFRNNTASKDNETLFFDTDKGEKILEENIYINTDIDMKTIVLTREEIPIYLSGEEVILGLNVELEHPNYYDADILEKLNKTLYNNDEEFLKTVESEYISSDLPVGEYSVYFIFGNQQSNTENFKVNGDMEVDVTNYNLLVQAIEHAKRERFNSYKINLLPTDNYGAYDAYLNITLKDSNTTKIIINGNNNTLNGRNTFQFINVPEGQELILENVKITNYKGENGGAIENEGTVTIINSIVENNKGFNGGAIHNIGTLTIINTTLENNNGTNGGAIDNLYGTITITDSTIQNNNGTDGGAILNTHGILTITNTTIQNNIGIWHGGAIYNDKGTLTVINSTIQNNTAEDGGAIYYETDRDYNSIITLYNSNFTDNKAEIGAVIYNNGGYGKYNITYNTFKDNTATEDNETLNLGENIRASTLEENIYINTDIDMKTIILTRKDEIPIYLLGEEVTFDFTVELEHPDYYDADILEKLNKTIYNNGTELFTTVDSEYISSDLPVGEYSVYFIAGNQQSNNVTFKINGDIEFNVSSYPVLAQAIEHAKQERFNSYTINLMENGDFDATQNLTLNDSATKKIIIKGNNNTLNGRNYYYFINVPEGQELILENVIITNYKEENGGAIFSSGTLTIIDSTIQNNIATRNGGAVFNFEGTLTIINSTIQNNTAKLGGAINNFEGTLTIINSTIQNNTADFGGAIYYSTDLDDDSYVTLYNSNFTDNRAGLGSVIYNDWGYGKYNITYNTFKDNTATEDNETLNLGENIKEKILEENSYINTDIDMKTLILTREGGIPNYLFGEDVTLVFTIELEHPEYYDADILEKLNKTIYNNDEENDSTIESDYTLSDLDVGEYSVYFIAGNQQSNKVTFKVNDDIEVNVRNYDELVQAIEHAEQERFSIYNINLSTGDYNATQNITWSDSVTKIIVIKGNNITLDGQDKYHFITIADGLNLTIENITITNYNASDEDNFHMFGGAILNYGILTITDSTLQNNMAELDGGAIENEGTLTITGSKFENNFANLGGAISNHATLNITLSTLENNHATYAGAIYNTVTLTVTDSEINSNNADERAGAIINSDGNLTIINSTLNNNKVSSESGYGGVIFNEYGDITIIESTFEHNTATWGGVIGERRPINGNSNIVLFNSSFVENTAENGAVIYNNGGSGTYIITYDITYNTFKNNTAGNDRETLHLGENNGERTVTENTYVNTDMKINTLSLSLKDDVTSYIVGEDVTLIFIAELEHPDYYETENPENLIINKTLYVNDEENDTTILPNYTLSDLGSGEYTVYYIISNQQSNTVMFEVFYQSEISTTESSYEYYRGVDNIIPLVITDDSGQKGMITVAVIDEDKYITISSYYNVGNGYQLSTESLAKALENLYETTDSSYTINVTYSNNDVIPSSTEFTLNIIKQRNTSIVYNIINNTEGNVQINITLVDAVYNTPIPGAVIEVTGDITTTTTSGIVTDTTLVLGEYSINVNYPETDDYKASQTTINFTVEIDKDKIISELENNITDLKQPKATSISIDPIISAKYGDEINITGLLIIDDSLSLSNQPVTITFNNEEETVITRNGVFNYTTTANVLGENTITATYAGSDKYNESTATYTFEVAKADTVITIDDIEAVKKGESVTITGTLTDHNGNALANKVVRLLINNGRKTLKTDADGVYTFDYALTRIGENTITATFEGDNYYTESTETVTVEALALSSVITIDPVDTIVKGTKATFTGTLMDENGEAIANAQVKLNINGNTKTLKTDSEGRFTHTFTMNTVGENIITATYAGSASYEAAEAEITVEVVKAEAVITLDPIDSITKGDNATFTGKLTDANGKAIANAQVRITINGSPKTLRTDENGVFTHTFKMIKEGTNNITAVFNGNNDFAAAETNSTVEVVKAE